MTKELISAVVPVYNEAEGLLDFNKSLVAVLKDVSENYEIVYVDDGSTDTTADIVHDLADKNNSVKLLKLSRNFGKEVATTAGIHQAGGQAIIILDGDGQHPVELIPEFIKRWQAGSKVVVGVRTANKREGIIKRLGSKIFYKFLNRFADMKVVPSSTDFRLIDHSVQQQFNRLTERNRITRGLIDWLGYKQDYIEFTAKARGTGQAGYSLKKLTKLFIDSVISLIISPLYIVAYIGAVVLPLSALIGLVMAVNALFGDPMHWHATGSAYLVVLLLFLVGVILVSQGIIGLYLSHIHTETKDRPLYLIDRADSVGINES